MCVPIFTENENIGIRLLRGKQAVWFGLVFITSVRCLNSTKYKYQEGQTKREKVKQSRKEDATGRKEKRRTNVDWAAS